jgi:biopolymer transport protein ExbD
MRVAAISIVGAILWNLAPVPAVATPTESTDLTIRASADGRCYFAEVVGQCDTLGETLVSMHKVPVGHVHIEVGPDAKYEVIVALLNSLERVGISPSRVGFIRAESHEQI